MFGVLAAEGFLPGYGLEVGSILGTAEIPFWRMGVMEFALPRPPSVALREYVPGNLIYANGSRIWSAVAERWMRSAFPAFLPMLNIQPRHHAVCLFPMVLRVNVSPRVRRAGVLKPLLRGCNPASP
jgi:hypothetical protein